LLKKFESSTEEEEKLNKLNETIESLKVAQNELINLNKTLEEEKMSANEKITQLNELITIKTLEFESKTNEIKEKLKTSQNEIEQAKQLNAEFVRQNLRLNKSLFV
jgi:uncharacterized phage infection (PIP) family protein YhgE